MTGTLPAAHMLILGRGQGSHGGQGPAGFYTAAEGNIDKLHTYAGGRNAGEKWVSEAAIVFFTDDHRGVAGGAAAERWLRKGRIPLLYGIRLAKRKAGDYAFHPDSIRMVSIVAPLRDFWNGFLRLVDEMPQQHEEGWSFYSQAPAWRPECKGYEAEDGAPEDE